jgi:predicted RNase H-like HicB family nuclease
MVKNMSNYTINYKRIENGWWLATVEGVAGCLTQGRTINQTRERIREALSLFVDDADTANLIDNIQLSAKIQRALNQFKTVRKRANEEVSNLQNAANTVASLLIENMNMSMRDAGELLGLSHQRIHQILKRNGSEKK